MKFYHLVEDADGISLFEDGEITFEMTAFAPPAPVLMASDAEDATKLLFLTLPCGWSGDRHPSPKRQVLFCLSGALLVQAGDGSERTLRAGDVWRMEDTSGPGHVSTVLGTEEFRAAIVQLEQQPAPRRAAMSADQLDT
ncbi:MAG: cupin [Paracoccaceae bacterium]